jgi:hypothetical protein
MDNKNTDGGADESAHVHDGSAFQDYMRAQAERRAAYERFNYAVSALENAQIKERLSEIKSQHEPLAILLAKPLSERDRLYAAAYYVVMGRLPNS